jgi:ADP-heptose:LPS heptosyltransferase
MHNEKMKLERILFVNLDRIGDIVRSTFLFRELRKHYPHAYIACLAAEPSDQFLRNDPHIDEVFSMPHKETRQIMEDEKTVLHMSFPVFELFEEMKWHAFDLIINPFSEFGAMLIQYVKPRYVLGRVMDASLKFLTYGEETAKFFQCMSNQGGIRAKNPIDFTAMYARILKDIGIDVERDDQRPNLFVTTEDKANAEKFLSLSGIGEDDLCVGFQIGAFTHEKMWATEKYRDVAEALQEEFNAKIIMTGSAYEADHCIKEMSEKMMRPPIIAAGQTSLTGSIALIKRCDLFISNDTGPMHIAAALNVPIIALFGETKTVPEESHPWGSGHVVFAEAHINDIATKDIINAASQKIRYILASKVN